MRRVTRLVSLLALGLSLGFTSACRQGTTPEGQAPEHGEAAQAELQLPDPLPLPANPRAASWIAEPAKAVAMVGPYSPVPLDPRAAAQQALAGLTEPGLASELSQAINLWAPFANVVLDDGQEVIRLSLVDDAREALASRFAELEAVGEFGAVVLPARSEAQDRTWLAWIDEGDGGSLVLANSLEGLVTGRELSKTYGQQPIFFTADPSALPIPADLPFSRVSGRGDLSEVVIDAQAIDGQDPLAGVPILPGTLGGLLEAPGITAGASGRYSEHEQTVREITSQVNAQVRQLPFLIRGVGEDLAAKLNTLLRTWDGRALVAIGPAKHLRLAYGASDVKKSEIATIRLLQKVVDNLSMARNFVGRLPKLNLRRRVAKAEGEDIELLVLHEAFSTVPQELRALVDDESRLNIAMTWSERAGGGLIVVGPNAVDELARWLEHSAKAPSHTETREQLLSASFAGEPGELQALLGSPELDPAQLLSLAATGPRWLVEVASPEAGRYAIRVRTPGPPKPARAKTN
jgi:hypothetical protein